LGARRSAGESAKGRAPALSLSPFDRQAQGIRAREEEGRETEQKSPSRCLYNLIGQAMVREHQTKCDCLFDAIASQHRLFAFDDEDEKKSDVVVCSLDVSS
jgi:hypothetical protein